MGKLTLRGIDDTLVEALKKASRKKHTSINKTAITLLKEALGLQKKKSKLFQHQDNLDGSWTGEEYDQFQETISDFGKNR